MQGALVAAMGVTGSFQMPRPAAADDGGTESIDYQTTHKIDVHAHYVPPAYRDAVIASGAWRPDGVPPPTWSPAAHVDMMDSLQIQTAMLSISSPGLCFSTDPVALARVVNEAGAAAVRDYPGRFGLFASLPLPDVNSSLTELTYAFDTLGADGVALLTNFNGTYLGHASFEPLFAELNRRRAVVFIHPTAPSCWQDTSLGYPSALLEFLLDTTRAISDLVLSGRLTRYPEVKLIITHSGAALPVIVDRIAGFAGLYPLGGQPAGAIDVVGTLQRLYYEVGAGFLFPHHIAALLNLVDSGQLLYGTDFPYFDLASIKANTQKLQHTNLLSQREVGDVLRGNSLELFPRLSDRRR